VSGPTCAVFSPVIWVCEPRGTAAAPRPPEGGLGHNGVILVTSVNSAYHRASSRATTAPTGRPTIAPVAAPPAPLRARSLPIGASHTGRSGNVAEMAY
jgi:hypothetical protein